MLYLEGEGRNTQIRDFTAFFLGTAIMSFLSLITKKYEWIFSVGIIYLLAAIFNVLASLNHDAPLAISSLVSEIIFFSIAVLNVLQSPSNTSTSLTRPSRAYCDTLFKPPIP